MIQKTAPDLGQFFLCHCEEEVRRRSNPKVQKRVLNLGVAALHFVPLAMTMIREGFRAVIARNEAIPILKIIKKAQSRETSRSGGTVLAVVFMKNQSLFHFQIYLQDIQKNLYDSYIPSSSYYLIQLLNNDCNIEELALKCLLFQDL